MAFIAHKRNNNNILADEVGYASYSPIGTHLPNLTG